MVGPKAGWHLGGVSTCFVLGCFFLELEISTLGTESFSSAFLVFNLPGEFLQEELELPQGWLHFLWVQCQVSPCRMGAVCQ